MFITVILLLAMLFGEPVPWYVPCITGGLALLLHGIILLGIAWSHSMK